MGEGRGFCRRDRYLKKKKKIEEEGEGEAIAMGPWEASKTFYV